MPGGVIAADQMAMLGGSHQPVRDAPITHPTMAEGPLYGVREPAGAPRPATDTVVPDGNTGLARRGSVGGSDVGGGTWLSLHLTGSASSATKRRLGSRQLLGG
jgi:hypothetical protein